MPCELSLFWKCWEYWEWSEEMFIVTISLVKTGERASFALLLLTWFRRHSERPQAFSAVALLWTQRGSLPIPAWCERVAEASRNHPWVSAASCWAVEGREGTEPDLCSPVFSSPPCFSFLCKGWMGKALLAHRRRWSLRWNVDRGHRQQLNSALFCVPFLWVTFVNSSERFNDRIFFILFPFGRWQFFSVNVNLELKVI